MVKWAGVAQAIVQCRIRRPGDLPFPSTNNNHRKVNKKFLCNTAAGKEELKRFWWQPWRLCHVSVVRHLLAQQLGNSAWRYMVIPVRQFAANLTHPCRFREETFAVS